MLGLWCTWLRNGVHEYCRCHPGDDTHECNYSYFVNIFYRNCNVLYLQSLPNNQVTYLVFRLYITVLDKKQKLKIWFPKRMDLWIHQEITISHRNVSKLLPFHQKAFLSVFSFYQLFAMCDRSPLQHGPWPAMRTVQFPSLNLNLVW